ncbi:hypothetical protein [Streptomyces capitiformicae]|uniref:Secreted protein n=1 Tax=Streptomyces capitiformicae TaxID=2014920 RepID=A0A919GCV5_9ACTN|nr:hypothetical protein [Streptomyces capitiformicae]GHH82144.1 hypothetical protein GCM10017771_05530 [Streptomyces capitiformicae]
MNRPGFVALGAAAVALGGSLFIAPTATAAAPGSASAAPAAAAACSSWFDTAGPGGAGRAHARCPGEYVRIKVVCVDGSTSRSAWRYGYAKAECPYGVKWESGEYEVR